VVDNCGDTEGLGIQRKLARSQRPPPSKVLSGGWLVSRSLFLSMDFSPEVRLPNGQINPSWPLIVGLRAASTVVKTIDWQAFYVAPLDDRIAVPGCSKDKTKSPRRHLMDLNVTSSPMSSLAEEQHGDAVWPSRNNNGNRSRALLVTDTAPIRLALLPLDTKIQDANRLLATCEIYPQMRVVTFE
jgi:hypothetical protein